MYTVRNLGKIVCYFITDFGPINRPNIDGFVKPVSVSQIECRKPPNTK